MGNQYKDLASRIAELFRTRLQGLRSDMNERGVRKSTHCHVVGGFTSSIPFASAILYSSCRRTLTSSKAITGIIRKTHEVGHGYENVRALPKDIREPANAPPRAPELATSVNRDLAR